MKHCTTSTHLNRTIHRLQHILAGETYPAIRAAELMAITLLELAELLPEAEECARRIPDSSSYLQALPRYFVLTAIQSSPYPLRRSPAKARNARQPEARRAMMMYTMPKLEYQVM